MGPPGHQGAPKKESIIPMAFTTCLKKIICQTLTNGSRLCFSRANCYNYVQKKKENPLNSSAVEDDILTVQADVVLKSRMDNLGTYS